MERPKYYFDENGKVVRDEAPYFSCPVHEETDTKISYHQLQEDRDINIKCSE